MWVIRFRDAMRARVAGVEAVAVLGSAQALFRAGGHRVLSAGAREVVHEVAEAASSRTLTAAAPALLARAASTKIAPALPATAVATVAARQIARGVGRAAAVGLVFDGVIGGAQAFMAYRRGTLSRRQAYAHTATEALTGALATGAGVALAASAVAVTGGMGAPVVFAVGAAGSIGAKKLLVKLLPASRVS